MTEQERQRQEPQASISAVAAPMYRRSPCAQEYVASDHSLTGCAAKPDACATGQILYATTWLPSSSAGSDGARATRVSSADEVTIGGQHGGLHTTEVHRQLGHGADDKIPDL